MEQTYYPKDFNWISKRFKQEFNKRSRPPIKRISIGFELETNKDLTEMEKTPDPDELNWI